jgi:hypothetical protein
MFGRILEVAMAYRLIGLERNGFAVSSGSAQQSTAQKTLTLSQK